MTGRPEMPQTYVSVEDHRERLSEVLDHIEHYVCIARSCNAVGDNEMLADAIQKIAKYAVGGPKTTRSLLDAVWADEQLQNFFRRSSIESGRHGA
ncbi:hypothetical protein MBRA_02481 [Methylobacterium brachiatum]|nr:hypothetical protein MBRA_02481 [Methylobacterium brachiatum]